MEQLNKLKLQLGDFIGVIILLDNLILGLSWLLLGHFLHLKATIVAATLIGLGLIMIAVLAWICAKFITQPFQLIAQSIAHVAPDAEGSPAPDTKSTHLGSALVTSLAEQVYQLATSADRLTVTLKEKNLNLHSNFVANNLPLPLFILDKNLSVLFANPAALHYINEADTEVLNKNLYSVLNMSFPSDQTFDAWFNQVKDKAITSAKQWDRVRININDDKKTLQFNLSAYYNQANPSSYDFMLILFDQTGEYAKDDRAMSYVALAVHELRTPLTLIRGYIEALEENPSSKLDQEATSFIQQIDASAQQLAAFINNVLNGARIEENQFSVQLHEEDWNVIVESAVKDMELRASVHNITIEKILAKDLPSVGVDKVSMYEVVCNLIDNALKYSGTAKRIIIKTSLNSEGLVETSIKDFGVGIPESLVPLLFDKFYRSHVSRSQVSGTGLGLYLCNAIVNAHDGHIWVRSKEGSGSIFSFTVKPYKKLSQQAKGDDQNLIRIAGGWIKNHSLYRR